MNAIQVAVGVGKATGPAEGVVAYDAYTLDLIQVAGAREQNE